jgi:hypothetical protein
MLMRVMLVLYAESFLRNQEIRVLIIRRALAVCGTL